MEQRLRNYENYRSFCKTLMPKSKQLPIFLRYEIRELRIIEAALESMPQLVLQFYYLVKLNNAWDDPLM